MLAGFALAGVGGFAAHAQDEDETASPETTQEEAAESQAAAEGGPRERIIVTGTRIRRDAFNSDAPLDVYNSEDAIVQGSVDIGSFLQSATVAQGSPQVTAATSAQFVQSGGTGAQTLSLRGLGANRTLVLLNGRRAGPAGTRGEVSSFDLNVLPLSAVERVEILKDGASSIYGSDAVAGVVNIITKTDSGGTVDFFHSSPFEGGGGEFRANGSYGREFSRGNFRVTLDYYRQEELAQGDRDYFQCGEPYVFNEDGSRADLRSPRNDEYVCEDLLWGPIWTYDYAPGFGDGSTNLGFGPPTLIQYDHFGDLGNYLDPLARDPSNPAWLTTPDGWYGVDQADPLARSLTDYDHPFQDASTMIPETERYTMFAEGRFDLSDRVTAYGEALLNRRKTEVNGYRQYWTYIYSSDYAPFFDPNTIAPGAGDPLSEGWNGAQWFSPMPITDHAASAVTVDYMRFVGGLEGEGLPALSDWT